MTIYTFFPLGQTQEWQIRVDSWAQVVAGDSPLVFHGAGRGSPGNPAYYSRYGGVSTGGQSQDHGDQVIFMGRYFLIDGAGLSHRGTCVLLPVRRVFQLVDKGQDFGDQVIYTGRYFLIDGDHAEGVERHGIADRRDAVFGGRLHDPIGDTTSPPGDDHRRPIGFGVVCDRDRFS